MGNQYPDVTAIAEGILVATIANQGGTFHANTGNAVVFHDEYIVGGAQDTTKVSANANSATIVEAIAAHIQRIPTDIHGEKRYFLGTWVEDGVIYIDSSEAYRNRYTAILKGKERGELAIYDTLARESVFI